MNDQRIVNYSLQSDMIVSKKVTLVPTKLPTQVTNVYKMKFSLHNISSLKIGIEPYYTSAQILTEKYGTKYH